MHEIINEPVDVIATFGDNRIIPTRMRWNCRDYHITSVNLVRLVREGIKRVFYFSVSDLTTYFKLKLDPDALEWHLVETYRETRPTRS